MDETRKNKVEKNEEEQMDGTDRTWTSARRRKEDRGRRIKLIRHSVGLHCVTPRLTSRSDFSRVNFFDEREEGREGRIQLPSDLCPIRNESPTNEAEILV